MNFTIDTTDRSRFKSDKGTLVLFTWEGEKIDTEGWCDVKKEKILEEIAKQEGYKSKNGEILVYHPTDEDPAPRLVLAGLGRKKEVTLADLREAAAKAVKATLKQTETVWIDKPRWPEKVQAGVIAQVLTEAVMLGRYRYAKYKSEDNAKDYILRKATLVMDKPEEVSHAKEGVKRGEIFSEAVVFVRDLVNEPPSRKRPSDIAKIAKTLGSKNIKVRIYQKNELERMGMHAILGVSSGSAHPPVLVEAVYKPKGSVKKRIALVGKGITFDSGGLNIKVGDHMTTMKLDMAGGATVLSVLRACDKLNLPVEVHAYAPFVENMPSGDSYKPGDVIKTYSGKTIEVLNTDAEGRVVLSDALAFAAKQNVDAIIDLATLTGAVTVALGDEIAALLSNNDKLSDELRAAANTAGEPVWPLPLFSAYKARIKGKVGDVINIANKPGAGTIIGALFLQEFIDGKPWAHFDIAGAAWKDGETPLCPAGGTGAMVRTLLEYLSN